MRLALQDGVFDRLPLKLFGKLRAELSPWLDATAGTLVGEIERGGSLDKGKGAELKVTLAALVARLTPPAASEMTGQGHG